MTERVLFVDDDPQILSAFKRGLRKRVDLHTAEGGEEGLAALESHGPFAVVISDQQMPKMDGVTFLKEVMGRSPDTVRMMLTGNADQKTATDAVNEGHVFRFLNKPCTPDDLAQAVDAAKQQYRLVTAERDLLEKTLAGSVKVLVDVLSLQDPDTFKQTARLRVWARKLAGHMALRDPWILDMTVMLASIGRITLPNDLAAKVRDGQTLTDIERDLVKRTPEVARDLIGNIPRFETVGNAVLYQNKGFDGSGFPADDVAGEDIPLEARVLRILTDVAALSDAEVPPTPCFDSLSKSAQLYDPALLATARECLAGGEESEAEVSAGEALSVKVSELQPGFKTAGDIITANGTKILAAGHTLTPALIEKMAQHHKVSNIVEPIHVIKG